MAGGMDLGDARRGKRPLDVVINLVLFIDACIGAQFPGVSVSPAS